MQDLPDDEEGPEEPELFLNDYERVKIKGHEFTFPAQPMASFTRQREEEFKEAIDVDVDYLSFNNLEDMAVPLPDGINNMEDLVSKVEDADEGDEIFEELKSGLQNAEDPANTLIGRHPVMKRSIDEISDETRVQLAKNADDAGINVFMAFPLIANPEKGGMPEEVISSYLDTIEEMNEETGEMTIVPEIHLSDAEAFEAKDFAQMVDDRFTDEEFPFIAITGQSPNSNKAAFVSLRDESSKRLVVDQCEKKVTKSVRGELGKFSRQELYIGLGAKIVLDKKHFIGGSSEGIEVVEQDSNTFGDTTIDEAESAVGELSFDEHREELEGSGSLSHFTGLHNELAVKKHVQELREKLREDEDALEGREALEEAINLFNS